MKSEFNENGWAYNYNTQMWEKAEEKPLTFAQLTDLCRQKQRQIMDSAFMDVAKALRARAND